MSQNLRTCVFILGSHRSGTSALTRLINLAGAEVGGDLLDAAPSNPKGHWESVELFTMQQRVLEELGMSWESPWNIPADWFNSHSAERFRQELTDFIQGRFPTTQLFVIKDPRSCRFAPVWFDAFERLGIRPAVVLALRNPHEVAHSLNIRNRMGFAWGYAMWLRYVLDAERYTRARNRCLVEYEDVLGGWDALLRKLAAVLKIEWEPRAGAEQEAAEFIDGHLRHHVVKDSDRRSRLFPHSVNAAYHALRQIGTRSSMSRLDRIQNAMCSVEAKMGTKFPPAMTFGGETQEFDRYPELLSSVDDAYAKSQGRTRW